MRVRIMTVLAPAVAVVGHSAGAGVPWLVLGVLGVLGLLVAGLRTVFPQDSSDRMAWWRERWRTKQRRRR